MTTEPPRRSCWKGKVGEEGGGGGEWVHIAEHFACRCSRAGLSRDRRKRGAMPRSHWRWTPYHRATRATRVKLGQGQGQGGGGPGGGGGHTAEHWRAGAAKLEVESLIVWRPKTERNDPRISRTGGRHSNTGPSRLSCCKDKVGEGQGAMPGSPALKVDALPLGHRGGRVVRMKLERGRGGGRAGGGEGQHAVEDFMLCRTEVEKCSICLCCGNCAGLIFRHLHIHLLVRSALTRDLGLGFRSGSGQP